MKRVLELMPLLPAIVLLWQLAHSPVLPLVLVVVALFVPQKRTDKPASAIVPTAFAGAVGFFVNQQLAELPELPVEQANYSDYFDFLASAAAALAAGATVRRRWTKPEGGEPLTLGLVLLSIACAAYGVSRWSVAIALTWVVVFSLHTIPEARRALLSLHGKLRTLVTLLLGAAVAAMLAWALPWLQAKAFEWFMGAMVHASSGLADRIHLGYDTNISLTNERVLRIRSKSKLATPRLSRLDYLRGHVLSRYWKGEWQPTGLPGTARPPPRNDSETSFLVELASPDLRVLLPRDSAHVSIPTKMIRVDSVGVPISDRPINTYSFELGDRDAFPISTPQSEDWGVPPSVRKELEPAARAWTANLTETKEQLDAIRQAFHSQFRWSLHSRRSTSGDPVVDFVLHERVGHCEFFASAMALMARSIGIPARVVTGYRIVEHNKLDDSYVVRKSHAHAWVEAWIEGLGWQTYDPTPNTPIMARHEQELLASILDLANARPKSAALFFLGMVAIVAAAISFRPKFGREERVTEGEPLLPTVATLVRVVARRSRRRMPGETLLTWARYVATAEELSVFERYSELRWGQISDSEAIELEADRLLKTASRRSTPG